MLLFVSLSFAAEILVTADAPITLEVDGRSFAPKPGERSVTATGLAGGKHRVSFGVIGGGMQVATFDVDVAAGDQVRLELRKTGLVEVGRGPLPTAAPAALPGGLQITGVDGSNAAAWIDGQPLAWNGSSLVADRVAAGTHDVRLVRGTSTLFSGSMRVFSELYRSCTVEGSALSCVHSEGLLAATAPAPVVVAPPPAPTKASMSASEFASVSGAVKAESFSSGKLSTLKSALATRWVSVAQLCELVDQFSSGGDRVEAVRIAAPRVVDPENAYLLDGKMTFSTDKEAVRAIFGK